MTQVQLLSMTNFNEWQSAKAEEARRLIEATVNAEPFQRAVLGAKFLDVRLEKANGTVVQNLTNQQILNVILSGTEQGSQADGVIGLRVALYYKRWSGTIGYFGGDGVIHSNSKFFNPWDPISVAGHWIHEWTHAAGFLHDYKGSLPRNGSVPYVIGELLSDHAVPFAKLL